MKRGTKGPWTEQFDAIEKYVGGNVRRLRIEKGMTQVQLAETVGIEVKTLQRIEAGFGNCTARVLAAFSDVFGVSPGDFFTHAEIPPRKRGRPKKVSNG